MIKIRTTISTDLSDNKINFKKISRKVGLGFKKNIKKSGNVSIVIINSELMKEMNFKYRMKNYVTDVLSFESDENRYLGDIFICLKKVYEQAEEFRHSAEREYAFLLVHGILHLLGFDHENSEQEKEMFTFQERILNDSGIER